MKHYTLFFSWQSEDKKSRSLIDMALESAVTAIKNRMGVEIEIDHSTLGESGMPSIDQTILKKIDECDIFLADVTPCCSYSKTEGNGMQRDVQVPNPNVLLELGYAMSAVGVEYTICVAHQGNWLTNDLPFDLNHRGIKKFNSANCDLTAYIEEILEYIKKNGRHRRQETPYFIYKINTLFTKIKDKIIPNKFEPYQDVATDHSTVFFTQRMAAAFPGVRGLKEYSRPREINKHLSKLLGEPLRFSTSTSDGTKDPIWFFERGHGLPIESYRWLGGSRFMIGWDELKIKRIVAFADSGRYYGQYVYIEAEADKPTGLYDYPQSESQDYPDTEEYAVFHINKFLHKRVTKQEEDDGHTKVLGRIVRIPRDKIDTRVRHLQPYNMILTAKQSPFNCREFEMTSGDYLDGVQNGTVTLEDFKSYMWNFPKLHW